MLPLSNKDCDLIRKQNNVFQLIEDDIILTYETPKFLDIDERISFDPMIMHFIDVQTKLLWTVDEIDYDEDDIRSFDKLPEEQKNIIKSIILFFTVADKLVISNLDNLKNIPYESALNFYKLQEYIESIHDQIYRKSAILYYNNNEKYIKDVELLNNIIKMSEKHPDEVFNLHNYDCKYFEEKTQEEKNIFYAVSLKVNMVNKWKNVNSYIHNLVAFFTIESIAFNCLFGILNIFKKRNYGLKYLIDINELVSRDENVHAVFGLEFYKNFILNKIPDNELTLIVREITETEKAFLEYMIPENFNLDNYRIENFKAYLENLANTILNEFDVEPCYKIKDEIPKEFNLQSLKIKTNFFERNNLYLTNDQIVKPNNVLDSF